MFWICLLLCFRLSLAVVEMEQKDWTFLETHPVFNRMTFDNTQLNEIVYEEWDRLRSLCPSLDANVNIQATFDNSLSGSTTLAWASQTMFISGNVWYPALTNFFYNGYDFKIGVNPNPPNGWFDGNCDEISYRYDLRTVIRHELLHGIGLSSSISFQNSWQVGDYQSSFCFPRLFDTTIKDSNGNYVVSGCNIGDITNKNLYVGGVPLYNPSTFNPGSSLSHHNYPGFLFYFRSEPMKCIYMSDYEVRMIREIGVQCSADSQFFPSSSESMILPTLLPLTCFCILFLLLL